MSGTTLLRIADFGPYTQSGQAPGDPSGTIPPPLSQMEEEIDFIANTNFANAIRLYTIDDQQSSLIDYAIQHDGLNVIPSVYLPNPNGSSSDSTPATWSAISSNAAVMSELNSLVSTLESLPTSDFSRIPFVVIGNEEISQVGGWSDTDIESSIEYVKSQLQQKLPSAIMSQLKFTTAETYDGQYMYLLNNGNGINTVDYSYSPADAQYYIATNMGNNPDINVIFANVTAYWDGVSVSNAASYVDQIYQKLVALYPGKEVVISETGWPSAGTTQYSGIFTDPHQSAVPSLANEQTYWQSFLQIANQQDISFGAFEAFNEPNKDTSSPTAVENNWGLILTNSGPIYTSSTFKTSVTSLLPPTSDDFTGNGLSDILFRNNTTGDSGYVALPPGGGQGSWFGLGTSSTVYGVVGVGDFTGNGVSDILFRDSATGDEGYLAMPPGGGQGSWVDLGPSSTAYSVIGVGDFTGNGVSDILFQDSTTGDTGIFLLTTRGQNTWQDLGTLSLLYPVVGVGDFTGDGTSDLLFRNNATGNEGYLAMPPGGGQGTWVGLGTSSTDYAVVGIGGFTGNGVSDILFRNNATGDTGYLALPPGGGQGTWVDLGISSTAYTVAEVGDFTGNGVSDILYQDRTTGDTGYYAPPSGGGQGTWHDLGNPSTAYAIVASPTFG